MDGWVQAPCVVPSRTDPGYVVMVTKLSVGTAEEVLQAVFSFGISQL